MTGSFTPADYREAEQRLANGTPAERTPEPEPVQRPRAVLVRLCSCGRPAAAGSYLCERHREALYAATSTKPQPARCLACGQGLGSTGSRTARERGLCPPCARSEASPPTLPAFYARHDEPEPEVPEASPSDAVTDYNTRRADEAAARRERIATAAIEAVADNPPVPLVPLAERLGVSVPLLRDAVKLAEQRQQLKTVPGGGKQSGVWPFDLAPETADERRAKLRELLAEGATSRLEVRDRTGWTAAQLQNALRTLPEVEADGDALRLATPGALAA